MSTLKAFLETIDPNRNILKIEKRTSEAFNSFDLGSYTISSVDQFRSCMSRFYWHIETYGTGSAGLANPDPNYTEGMAGTVLDDLYGVRGEAVAFEMARGGTGGGLYQVLKDITARQTRRHADNVIASQVLTYLSGLSVDEQLQAAEEYIRDYGHLLPSDLTQGGAWRIKAVFHKVLSEHPYLISRMRQIGRS